MPKHRRPTRAELLARMPRVFRPRLARDQIRDLALVHAINLDAIATGTADEELLWHVVGGVLTWSRVAEALQTGLDEMALQLALAKRLVDRYGRTGRVAFDGPDYQLAKTGLDVMDQLAELVDQPTATAAADWAEATVNAMSAECAAPTTEIRRAA